MAYTPDYTSGDISAAAIDTIAIMIITVSSLAVVVILILMYNWARKRF